MMFWERLVAEQSKMPSSKERTVMKRTSWLCSRRKIVIVERKNSKKDNEGLAVWPLEAC